MDAVTPSLAPATPTLVTDERSALPAHATFRHMRDGTADDWGAIAREFGPYARALPGRLLDHLNLLKGDCGGFPVDRLTHSLQTATR
jgi:hypothetical protein